MYPLIPVELAESVAQFVVCFVSTLGALLGLMLCRRA